MSEIPFTILIGSAGVGPDGNRTFMPLSVARFWTEDTPVWTFHDLDDPEAGIGRVVPATPASQVGALLAGIAAYLVGDPDVFDALDALAPGDADPVIDREANGVLVDTARASVEDLVRLTVVTELPVDGGQLIAHEDFGDMDVELVLVPVH